jgi:hypothetical protein
MKQAGGTEGPKTQPISPIFQGIPSSRTPSGPCNAFVTPTSGSLHRIRDSGGAHSFGGKIFRYFLQQKKLPRGGFAALLAVSRLIFIEFSELGNLPKPGDKILPVRPGN